ncbi:MULTISPECIES: hypothetical protein [unclassified Empedobacter]|uniref:hypothetical protein n=1 Tax=unclassified Empedobacter TaxID=2643773 RepID=UPI0025BF3A91|nr:MULTISPECIES: hypothetical protein [unclassified Empedobacter]
MSKLINPLSYCILAILLFLILSVNFFPIEGLGKLYKYRIVLIVLYVMLRLLKHFVYKENIKTKE